MLRKRYDYYTDQLTTEGTFTGRASVFGEIDTYKEVTVKGAFQKAIERNNGTFDLLWQHDSKMPIGLATMAETDLYLESVNELNLDVQTARDAHSHLKFYNVKKKPMGLSIGYYLPDGAEEPGEVKGVKVTFLKEIDLQELSVVTFPACGTARVTDVKNINQIVTIRDFEDHLRESGFSRNKAIELASQVWKAAQRDAAAKSQTDAVLNQLSQLETQIRRHLNA